MYALTPSLYRAEISCKDLRASYNINAGIINFDKGR
jgi:hypothetical protein